MKVITSPQLYAKKQNDLICFLAGGISNCKPWQDQVIKELQNIGKGVDLSNLVIINPRCKNFNITDPYASYNQIKWEFNWLEQMDLFSMYFCESESVQPICMYELGRNLIRMQQRFPDFYNRIIIGIEQNYKRKQDVMIQTQFAVGSQIIPMILSANTTPELHALGIVSHILALKGIST